MTELLIPLTDPLVLPFEPLLARSCPSLFSSPSSQSTTNEQSTLNLNDIKYRLRYPVYMPMMATGVAAIAGIFQAGITDASTGRYFSKQPSHYFRHMAKSIRVALIGQACWSFLTTATWHALGIDNYGTRALFGAATGYALGSILQNFRVGFWAVPGLAAVSIGWKFFEDGGVGLSRVIKYERQRERAIQLLDPRWPDYEQLREALTPKRRL